MLGVDFDLALKIYAANNCPNEKGQTKEEAGANRNPIGNR
jgi:hypothetical protein